MIWIHNLMVAIVSTNKSNENEGKEVQELAVTFVWVNCCIYNARNMSYNYYNHKPASSNLQTVQA